MSNICMRKYKPVNSSVNVCKGQVASILMALTLLATRLEVPWGVVFPDIESSLKGHVWAGGSSTRV